MPISLSLRQLRTKICKEAPTGFLFPRKTPPQRLSPFLLRTRPRITTNIGSSFYQYLIALYPSALSTVGTYQYCTVAKAPRRMADTRYCVEYAKTGRSSCKKCKQQIEKGVSRIGKISANPFNDDGGDMKVWYHMRCMFETLKV